MPHQIGQVRYQNFGPFEDVSLDFAHPGLTCISGRTDLPGCEDNGAGKSMLFDGVAWALYGRCLRARYTGENIRRGVWKEHKKMNVPPHGSWTCVTVEILGGDDTVSVERYRNHPKHKNHVRFIVGGEDRSRGRDDDTTDDITTEIGMDFKSFCNSVAFAAREDVSSFLADTTKDTERKAVLYKIFGLEIYAEAAKVASKRHREAQSRLSDLQMDSTRLETRLEERQRTLERLKQTEGSDSAEFRVRLARARVGCLRRYDTRLTQVVRGLKSEMREEKREHEAEVEKYDVVYRAWFSEGVGLRDKIIETDREIALREGEVRSIEKRIVSVVELGLKEACPTCLRPFGMADEADQDQVTHALQGEKNGLEQEIMKWQVERDVYQTEFDARDEPVKPFSVDLRATVDELEQEKARRESVRGDQAVAEARLEEVEDRYGKLADRLAAVKVDIQSDESELEASRVAVDYEELVVAGLNFWAVGFGTGGIPSFLLEAEIPEVNRRATITAQKLLGSGARVRLQATRELKSKEGTREEITVEGLIPGCTNTYAGASRGQKRRMDLSLVLAFREIISGRAVKSFLQLFADEIFDGTDDVGVETIGNLLRDLSEECPVALVSHDPKIKQLADRHIIVYHDGVTATLQTA